MPNSFVDVNHPEGYVDARYFRGSGTSEATAITSGAVALVLQKYPNLTPDQVKRPKEDFFATRDKSCRYGHFTMGAGKIDIQMVCNGEGHTQTTNMAGSYTPTVTVSDGHGGSASVTFQSSLSDEWWVMSPERRLTLTSAARLRYSRKYCLIIEPR